MSRVRLVSREDYFLRGTDQQGFFKDEDWPDDRVRAVRP
jgi:hypothetical protein